MIWPHNYGLFRKRETTAVKVHIFCTPSSSCSIREPQHPPREPAGRSSGGHRAAGGCRAQVLRLSAAVLPAERGEKLLLWLTVAQSLPSWRRCVFPSPSICKSGPLRHCAHPQLNNQGGSFWKRCGHLCFWDETHSPAHCRVQGNT